MRTEYEVPEPDEGFYEEVFLATETTTGILKFKQIVKATLLAQQNAMIRQAVKDAYETDELRFVRTTFPSDVQPGDYVHLSPDGKKERWPLNVFLYLGEDVFYDGELTFDRDTLYDIARKCKCKITVYESVS